ncbi:MAG: alpha/beta fold hydrolase [Planctomycetota bacterium]
MDPEFYTSVILRSLVRVPRAERGRPLVIALHGWGMRARQFERWLRPGIEAQEISWWIPRGILPCEIRSRKIGFSWYVFDGDQDALRESMNEARSYLCGLVEQARAALDPSSVALLGFSQGAYLASYVSLSRPDLFDRFVCCCGRPKAEFIDDLEGARATRVLVQVGDRDENVKPELIRKGVDPLVEAGLDVTLRGYDATHRIVPQMARAHNLLCIQGFVGEGYSPEFVANMARVVDSLGPAAEVTVTAQPDTLCAACPHLAEDGCTLSGPGAERGIVRQDKDVMARLGIIPGETLRWGDIVERITAAIDPDDLDDICGTCPWLPLGVCKAGLARLRTDR